MLDFEGCLSLPDFSGRVPRAKKVRATYQDRFGKKHEVEVQDEMARCFQHEIDHLNGILYIDRVADKFVLNPETNEGIQIEPLIEFTKKGNGR